MTSSKRGRPPSGRKKTDDPGGLWPPPVEGKCNARLDREPKRRCRNVAGLGTPYKVGACVQHGGGHENGRKHAARLTYEAEYAGTELFGEVVEMPHALGLAYVAGKLAGFAAYVEHEIARTAGDDGRVQLVEMVPAAGGGQREAVNVRVKLWTDALAELARVHKMAIDAGVAQQQLDLVASYQDRVIDVLEQVLRDVGVDPDDPAVAERVGARLALVSGAPGGGSAS